MRDRDYNGPELGSMHLVLVPERDIQFNVSSARSLHAAVLRRIESIAPDFASSIHDSIPGAHSTTHPLTVSALCGRDAGRDGRALFTGNRCYRAVINALTTGMVQMLDATFNPAYPFGREPLELEGVAVYVRT